MVGKANMHKKTCSFGLDAEASGKTVITRCREACVEDCPYNITHVAGYKLTGQ